MLISLSVMIYIHSSLMVHECKGACHPWFKSKMIMMKGFTGLITYAATIKKDTVI
jgi:hypothetical protein